MKGHTVELEVDVKLSLWSAIKLRIAGMNQLSDYIKAHKIKSRLK